MKTVNTEQNKDNALKAGGDLVQTVVMKWKSRADKCDEEVERSDDIENSYNISLKQRTNLQQAAITLRNCADELSSISA